MLPLALAACTPAIDPTGPTDPDPVFATDPSDPFDPDASDRLVAGVTSEAAAGGLVTATYLDGDGVEVEIGGAPVEAEPIAAASGFGLWRVPADLPLGPTDILFRLGELAQREELVLVEPWFEESSQAVGLGTVHQTAGWPQNCAQSLTGIGVADLDLDGDFDVVRGNLTGESELYLAQGKPADHPGELPTFVDQTLQSTFVGQDLVVSVNFADYDNDGDPDLFLGRRGPNRLFENRMIPDGIPRLRDVTAGSGLVVADQRTTGGEWGDYDNDGDLDLYEVNHTWCYPGVDPQTDDHRDHLYRNDGGHFAEVTRLLPDDQGAASDRFGFAAIWLDLDRDHDQDLVVLNDFVMGGGRTVVWRNDGRDGPDWAFTDISADSAMFPVTDSLGKSVNAMGGAVGDLNRDGLPDFAASNIGPNLLSVSVSAGHWAQQAGLRGVERTLQPWGEVSTTWGTHLLDLDLDRDLDLWFVGGALSGSDPQPHALFENQGDGLPMKDRSFSAGVATIRHGAASAEVDLDGDGYLDLIVANWAAPLDVWHNRVGTWAHHHWVVVDPRGDGVVVNRDGLGAIVELTHRDGLVDSCFRNPRPSMSATGDPGCRFGLGAETEVQQVRIFWPDGVDELVDVAIDQRNEITRVP